jgi:toxin ParE1/3/4
MSEKHRRVVWAPRAREDLRDIWRHYAQVASPEIADQVLKEIANVSGRLADHALMWRARDEVAPGLRSVLSHPYLIFYRVADDSVEVARVLHGRRNFAEAFKRER